MGKPLMSTLLPRGSELGAAVEPIVAAAMRGQYELLVAEAERAVARHFPGASARLVVHTGGRWHEASSVDAGNLGRAVDLDEAPSAATRATDKRKSLFVPVVPGAVGLLVEGRLAGLDGSDDLAVIRQCLALALQTCERQRIAAKNLDEVQALQRVATRMLKSHELSEILLLITQEAKRLLSADICGVLLREGEQIVMRRCVGNHSPDTAALRMSPGQGLAGRVLATHEPASVEDYLASDSISRDFFPLAQAERVRSALATPLLARDAVIGVLEVWRRRPSTFTVQDTTRLVALANLTSIAIENAELYVTQARMVDELGRANDSLEQRYGMVRSLSNLTHNLLQMLLQGVGLGAITTAVSGFLQTDVGMIDSNGQVLAWSGNANTIDRLTRIAASLMAPAREKARGSAGETRIVTIDGQRWHARTVVVQGDPTGWVVSGVAERGADVTDLTLTQLAMFAALFRLEQRAATRARLETIDATVWDLLRSDAAARAAAIDRAGDIKLNLEAPLRLYLCELGPTASGSAERAGSELRQRTSQVVADLEPEGVRAVAMHGLSIAVLCGDKALDDIERLAHKLALRLSESLDGRTVMIGGSSRCLHARSLHIAHREALIALDVARHLGRTGAIVYDRAGVVGLLLSLRHEVGMQRFLELNLGGVLREDAKRRHLLMHTLRVFFDVNCSHEVASQRLGVHRKTIAHRLAKISELTGLDLSTHDDRLVADLSLYVYRLLDGVAQGPD
jgi:sugar diacid utilization regulator/putative methionine-R-sulfoxide reductase with GAF domain